MLDTIPNGMLPRGVGFVAVPDSEGALRINPGKGLGFVMSGFIGVGLGLEFGGFGNMPGLG